MENMGILDTVSGDGFCFKSVSASEGGVFKGPCPWCGGKDRFSIYPNKRGGWYICNQCGKQGDEIQYLRDFRGLSYPQACSAAGKVPDFKPAKRQTISAHVWAPRESKTPDDKWQVGAKNVLIQAFKFLMSGNGKQTRDYLNGRGLDNNTIKTARLGYNPADKTLDPAIFGLEQDKNIWIPKGILIPFFDDATGELLRIRVRQDNPIGSDRFLLLSGSSTDFFRYPGYIHGRESIIFEAELDGWLCWQHAKDKINIFAIGNSTTRPDKCTHEILSKNKTLFSLDNDDAGKKEAIWWGKNYKGIPHYTPKGKDLSDRLNFDLDIPGWIDIGLSLLRENIEDDNENKKNITKIKIETKRPEAPELKKERINFDKADPKGLTKPAAGDRILCRHEKACQNFKDGACLINKKQVHEIELCPRNFWKCHGYKTEIEQIIIQPGYYYSGGKYRPIGNI